MNHKQMDHEKVGAFSVSFGEKTPRPSGDGFSVPMVVTSGYPPTEVGGFAHHWVKCPPSKDGGLSGLPKSNLFDEACLAGGGLVDIIKKTSLKSIHYIIQFYRANRINPAFETGEFR